MVPPNPALRSVVLQKQISILGIYQNDELLKIQIHDKHSYLIRSKCPKSDLEIDIDTDIIYMYLFVFKNSSSWILLIHY